MFNSNTDMPIRSNLTVRANQNFSITLEEPACVSCSWDTQIPSSIIIMQIVPHNTSSPTKREWILLATQPGSYKLTFVYRRNCCGRAILKNQEFMVTVL